MLVVGMHLGIYASTSIFFEASTYFLLLLGLPWNRLFDVVLEYDYSRLFLVKEPA